jgi:hypothetical protein
MFDALTGAFRGLYLAVRVSLVGANVPTGVDKVPFQPLGRGHAIID